jgi:uncharacterized membrane protein YphA (DoxX/SURF4 family)
MGLAVKARHVPTRLAAGAYILHSGLGMWGAGEEQARGTHDFATSAFPFLKDMPPARFTRLMAAGELATGTLLLAPFVPAAVAGAALTALSGGLMAFYMKAPGLRKEGSIWPTENGIGIAKDVWILGIGLSLLADAAERR